jgi:hypothetical protein
MPTVAVGRENSADIESHYEDHGAGRLTGAYARGAEAGEWLQQATLAVRSRVPLHVLRAVIQSWPAFSSIHADALTALQGSIAAARQLVGAGSS